MEEVEHGDSIIALAKELVWRRLRDVGLYAVDFSSRRHGQDAGLGGIQRRRGQVHEGETLPAVGTEWPRQRDGGKVAGSDADIEVVAREVLAEEGEEDVVRGTPPHVLHVEAEDIFVIEDGEKRR